MIERRDRLLVAHVVYRFDVGGLENGLVNLINRLPREQFRHVVLAMTEVTDFHRRVGADDVQFISLHKPPGQGLRLLPALYRAFRQLRPDIVHTRNLAPLEASFPAWLAGVGTRIHGEHGWDVADLDGDNRAHRWTRRVYRPFVTHYVALSKHIEAYLRDAVGVAPDRITQLYNGVDTHQFRHSADDRALTPFSGGDAWLVGTVGRLVAVKDQATLVHALALAARTSTAARERIRLVIVGEGPLRGALTELARSEGLGEHVWLAGERNDVAKIFSALDAFALPSLAEGISNTILEAMATALPVVATRVGGNAELIDDSTSGTLVPPRNPRLLADAMLRYFNEPATAAAHGAAARRRVEERFSLDRMVGDYAALYRKLGRARTRGGLDLAAVDRRTSG